MSEKIKLDDKIVKEHISDWSYEIKDDLGNKVVKQKGDRAYTPFNVPKSSSNYFFLAITMKKPGKYSFFSSLFKPYSYQSFSASIIFL